MTPSPFLLPKQGAAWIGAHCDPALVAWGRTQPQLRDLHLETCLGSGNQSMVFRGRIHGYSEFVTVKVFDKGRAQDRRRTLVFRELQNHLQLPSHHAHVLRAHLAFEDAHAVYLVMQYASHGDLFRFLQTVRPLREIEVVQWIIAPVLLGLAELHAHGIVHRDIKPENIFLGPRFEVLIGDFGLSIQTRHERPASRVGTAEYWAPEVIRRKPYDAAVDIWTVGILAFELLHGRTPFVRSDPHEMESAILAGTVPSMAGSCTSEAEDFVRKVLQQDPTMRPTAVELLEHPWLTSIPRRRWGRVPADLLRTTRRS